MIGISTVSINDASATSTTINADNIGRLLLGATNVTNINAQGTSHLVMDLPDTGGGVYGNDVNSDNPILFHGVDVFGSNNGDELAARLVWTAYARHGWEWLYRRLRGRYDQRWHCTVVTTSSAKVATISSTLWCCACCRQSV